MAPGRVRLGAAEHLAGDGGDLAGAEQDVVKELGQWAALGPLEVDVRQDTVLVAQVQADRRDGVGHGGAGHGQNAVAVAFLAGHLQAGGELRGVGHGHL